MRQPTGSVEVQEASSLVAQMDANTHDKKRESQVQKRVRPGEAVVQKALCDNFPGFSEEELCINEYAFRMLANQVRYDMERNRGGEKVVMGKGYYAR